MASKPTEESKLRYNAIGMLGALGIQFLLGVAVSLWFKVPDNHPGTSGDNFFSQADQGIRWAIIGSGFWPLSIHAILGTVLIIGSLTFLYRSIRMRKRGWVLVGIGGVVGIISAALNGAAFINYGHELNSFIMASGFLLSAVSYTFALML